MGNINLLLVDDELEFRDATSRALVRRGFNVRQADSGERALQMVATAPTDAVVLDLRMPGLDGIETLQKLRETGFNLPVIILTGQGTFDDALAGVRLGIVDFVKKPVDMDILSCRLRALAKKGERTRLRERTLAELMVPASSYRRVYTNQEYREVILELKMSLAQVFSGEIAEQGHRSVLVFDRNERFVGVLTLTSLLAQVLPKVLRASPYSSYLTGMFVAQCKLIGDVPLDELQVQQESIEVDAPLMEALQLLVKKRLTCLPVLKDGNLVGLLRDRDLLFEVANLVDGYFLPGR